MKKMWRLGIPQKVRRMVKKLSGYARSVMIIDGEIFRYIYGDIVQGIAQGCPLSPALFKVFVSDTYADSNRSSKARSQSGGREEMVPKVIFTHDLVGTSKINPPEYQKECRNQ